MQVVRSFFLGLLIAVAMDDCYGFTYQSHVKSRDGQCVDKDNTLHAVGETWYKDESCVRESCSVDSKGQYTIDGAGCGTVHIVGIACPMVSSPGHYPGCCPRPKCD